MGMGRGGGMGRGRGMGRGMGAGLSGAMPAAPQAAPSQVGGEQEVDMLRAQAEAAADQLRAIEARIRELEQSGSGAAKSPLAACVDSDKCTACGLCEDACPTGAITIDDMAQIDLAKCTGCGRCVTECPNEALSLQKRPPG